MQYLRLLLIIAMVLAPVQGVFAVQLDMHSGGLMNMASNQTQSSELPMFEENYCNHTNGENCQSAAQCGNCPLSLTILRIASMHSEMNAQSYAAITGVSFYSADLSPDYRPPRYS